ncbi:MAG TPA: hypothetical protein VGP70_14125 [Actinomadura sp.]|nr:hypothetical protein [Actinomadura sp.]
MRRGSFIFALLCALVGTSVLSAPTALAARSATGPLAPPQPTEWTVVLGGGTPTSAARSLYFIANGRYTSAELAYTGDNHAMLRARATVVGPWERFMLRWDPRTVSYVLQSLQTGRYVSTELGYAGDKYAMLRARATAIGPSERYALFQNRRTGRYALWSKANLRFVSTELGYAGGSKGMLRAGATAIGPQEQFLFA